MQSDGDSGLGDLEAQLVRKEMEWKELQAAMVHQLETSLKTAQEECLSLRERYQQLKEDFQFNLAILDERDRELERYDALTSSALTEEKKRQEELNHFHMQVAGLEEQRTRAAEERQEELRKSRHNAGQQRLQLDELKCSMATKIQKQTEEYERMKWDSQFRIQELAGELTLQRQETTAASEAELRQREHEFNLKMDEMRAVVLSCDLKVKLLSKETEVQCQAHAESKEALLASQVFCEQLRSQLLHRDHEIRDLTAAKDCRIKELEDKLKRMETKLRKEESNHIKKCEDVIRALKECALQLEAQYQAHTEKLQEIEKRVVKLHENVEVLAARVRCKLKDQQDAMDLKDETIQRLRTEVDGTRTGWDRHISQFSSEMVVKDTEIISLQERATKCRTELERSREDIERYKQQLGAGLQREKALEQKKVQVELEWQRRCEDMKAQHYLANEQLIQELTQARDQAKADLHEKEQDLQDLSVLLRCVKTERDQALQGVTPQGGSLASEEIHRLQQQNSSLRAVITQMRKDMEGLIHLLPHPQPQASTPLPVKHPGAPAPPSLAPTTDNQVATGPTGQSTDTGRLDQVSLLKARCRHLEEQLEATGKENLAPLVPDNTHLQNQGLKQGVLLSENGADPSALDRQEVRVAHIESALAKLMKQTALVRQLQEENLCLKRQQTPGQMSGSPLEDVQGAENKRPVLHSRLKQAASCIARLSRDKQQLIEMGNRLRAQITTAGPQESVEPERDSFTENQGEHHDRLSALEQLQYQLTTQELQYALRQQHLPPSTNRGPSTEGAANPRSQGHTPSETPESSKTKEKTVIQSQGSMQLSGVSRSLLSSEDSLQSLKELWEKLDHGFSLSMLSEGEAELSRRKVHESGVAGADGGAGVQMTAEGTRAPVHSRLATEVQQKRIPSKTPSNKRMCKIRNYNVKS
ncbi:coiled-coil domain-containing protein 57 isoform X2 [Gymnodraco acuticeps]|uniref:Coiled-coil domain-containing protein 57 isoform X2 n=1 Tax=Gymnodraco acuticeps TaxID=8218 RepID=A0A6P8W7A3_GYMAC|nr:coiled-coil domain-containing protein 57 isoform X2 [Gymnodraco acuticeps]